MGDNLDWHVSRGNQKAGPFTEAQLRGFITEGRLLPSDLIWRTGDAAWQRADSIPGLFSPPETPPAAPTLADTLRAPAALEAVRPADTRRAGPASRAHGSGGGSLDRREAALEAFREEQWSGFWRRAGAQWLDGIIIAVPAGIFSVILGALFGDVANPGRTFALYFLAQLTVWTIYQSLMNGAPSVATFGRRATGIAVVDQDTGEPISRGRAAARAIVSWVSAFLVIPELVQLLTRRRQALSDFLCSTTVVRYREGGSAGVVIAAMILIPVGIGVLAAIAIPQYQQYTVRTKTSAARTDLGTYAEALERHVRSQNEMPDSLSTLQATPLASSASYALRKDGAIVATGFEDAWPNAYFALVPRVASASTIDGGASIVG
jgi:uncharacterized RDD family membrane protein YckC/Tfp pilus assembly protein PilE